MKSHLFAQYELVDRKVSVTLDAQEEAYLWFANAIDHLPRKSAGPRLVAGFVPGRGERAEKEFLLDKATKAVVIHLAQPVPKMLLALLSLLIISTLRCDAHSV